MKSKGFVHICMVTFNRLDFTKQAINALMKFTDYPYVLTVIDNKSDDGTQAYLQSLHKKKVIDRLILLDSNIGIAPASNLGWHLEPDAKAYVKFDNDIVIEKKGWLSAMVKVMEAVPQIGMLGYNLEPFSYPLVQSNGVSYRLKEKGAISGCCVMIPKHVNEKLGYWIEEYGLYGEEDADFAWRVRLAGYICAYMEDEHIGSHLPAGRQAMIYETSEARDGKEEVVDRQYRLWKDAQRWKNVKPDGLFHRNIKAYQDGTKSLFIDTKPYEVAGVSLRDAIKKDPRLINPLLKVKSYIDKGNASMAGRILQQEFKNLPEAVKVREFLLSSV